MEKISYDRRDYESVDETSLANDEKNNSGSKGITRFSGHFSTDLKTIEYFNRNIVRLYTNSQFNLSSTSFHFTSNSLKMLETPSF